MKIAATVSILLLASCTTLDIDEARLSGGLATGTATNEFEAGGEQLKESADTEHVRLRAELTNHVAPDLSVGLIVGYGEGDVGALIGTQYDVGAVARQYLTGGDLRPFVEFAAGYRREEVDHPFVGKGSSDMIFGSAGAGLEWQATESFSLFGSASYEGAYGDGYDTHGPTFFFGGGWKF